VQPGLKKDSHCTSRFHAVEINGSVVLDRDSNLLAFGAILRHRPPLDQDEEVGEGGRTAAAISALTNSARF
jgi:hypothetical protein